MNEAKSCCRSQGTLGKSIREINRYIGKTLGVIIMFKRTIALVALMGYYPLALSMEKARTEQKDQMGLFGFVYDAKNTTAKSGKKSG